MASKEKIAELMVMLYTTYPQFYKDTNMKDLATAWHIVLGNLSDEEAEQGLVQAMRMSKFPPTPGEVIERINELKPRVNTGELWDELMSGMYRIMRQKELFRFTAVEENGRTQGTNAKERARSIYENLDPRIKEFIGSYGEALRICDQSEEDDKFMKIRFDKEIPEIDRIRRIQIESEQTLLDKEGSSADQERNKRLNGN